MCTDYNIFAQEALNIPAAHENIDSLLSKLESARDSSKAKILISLMNSYFYFDRTKAIQYGKSAIQVSNQCNYLNGIITASSCLVKLYLTQGNLVSAIDSYQKILDAYTRTDNKPGMARTLYDIGTIYLNFGNNADALSYYRRSLKIRESVGNDADIISSLTRVATTLARLEDNNEALDNYFRALTLARKKNMGQVTGNILSSVGTIYKDQHNYLKALWYYNEALVDFNKLNFIKGIANINNRIGSIYLVLGKNNTAAKYFFRSLKASEAVKDSANMARSLIFIADGYSRAGDLNKSIDYSERGLALAKEIRNIWLERDALDKLSAAYAKNSNYKKAFEYQSKSIRLSDSLSNLRSSKQITGIQSSYENEKQNLVIKLQEAELERQKQFIYIILGALAIFILLTIFLIKIVRDKHKMNNLLKQQTDNLSQQQEIINQKNSALAESNAVKDKLFTIIAHDLRSPFWALKGIIDLLHSEDMTQEEFKQITKRLGRKVESMGILLENLLNWASSQKDGGSYSPEVINLYNLVEENLELVKRAADEKYIVLVNEVNKNDKAYADIDMIRLVLRNLVTNAIKFTNEKGKIIVKSFSNDGQTEISVIDNGVGISKENLADLFKLDSNITTVGTAGEKGSGLGLGLCKEFIEMNGGKISVESEAGKGSTFKFSLKGSKEKK